MNLADRIDALLPQTQCTRCGYPSCRDYASAVAAGKADINQCPPGGAAGIAALADLLDHKPLPLNPANGVEKPREIAFIDDSALNVSAALRAGWTAHLWSSDADSRAWLTQIGVLPRR